MLVLKYDWDMKIASFQYNIYQSVRKVKYGELSLAVREHSLWSFANLQFLAILSLLW